MEQDRLIACHDCDALFQKPRLGRRRLARCPRCGAVLYGSSTGRLDPICAMTMAALITFLIAQTFPIIELEAMRAPTFLKNLVSALNDCRENDFLMLFIGALDCDYPVF